MAVHEGRSNFSWGKTKLQIIMGDITGQDTEAIVNAANKGWPPAAALRSYSPRSGSRSYGKNAKSWRV